MYLKDAYHPSVLHRQTEPVIPRHIVSGAVTPSVRQNASRHMRPSYARPTRKAGKRTVDRVCVCRIEVQLAFHMDI